MLSGAKPRGLNCQVVKVVKVVKIKVWQTAICKARTRDLSLDTPTHQPTEQRLFLCYRLQISVFKEGFDCHLFVTSFTYQYFATCMYIYACAWFVK